MSEGAFGVAVAALWAEEGGGIGDIFGVAVLGWEGANGATAVRGVATGCCGA
jgi:hypothetical protein